MRHPARRTMAAVLAVCGLMACGGSDLSAAEQRWAEQATLEIARVNDEVALDLLTAVLGEQGDATVVVVDRPPSPDWPKVERACSDLLALLPAVRTAAKDAPERFTDVGRGLDSYADKLDHFASGCLETVPTEDFDKLSLLNADLVEAGTILIGIGEDLPDNIGCPADEPDPPQTCEE